jgi:hypothetical protein
MGDCVTTIAMRTMLAARTTLSLSQAVIDQPCRPKQVASFRFIVLTGATLIALLLGARMLGNQQAIAGWEAYAIARAVATGHGYSFPGENRRLFDQEDGPDAVKRGRFFPTAWVDPVYTYALAAIIRGTGSWHRVAGSCFNLLLFISVVVLTFECGCRIEGPRVGAVAALLVTVVLCGFSHRWVYELSNTLMAGVAVLTFAVAAQGLVSNPALTSQYRLGVTTGFTMLACPGATAFFLVALLVAFLACWPGWRSGLRSVIAVACAAILVLMPWAGRNYLVFGEFVPLRTGAGQITFIGVVATGATVEPQTLKGGVNPPWRARSAQDAVAKAQQRDERKALEAFQVPYARAIDGRRYGALNEAQRDRWFSEESRQYVARYPVLAAELAFWKIMAFASVTGIFGVVLMLCATLGGVMAIVRRRLDLFVLAMCIAAFMAPFALVVPYFARYRLPIEPIVVILAAATVSELRKSIKTQTTA